MRKILSLTLAILMVVTMLPLGLVFAYADGAVAAVLNAGGTEKATYNSFNEAVAAVLDGETVKLLADATVGTASVTGAAAPGRISTERPAIASLGNITIDGNGKTLTYYHDADHAVDYFLAFPFTEGELTVTIKDLTIDASHNIGLGDIGEVNTNGFILRNAAQKLVLENVTVKNDSADQTFLLNGGTVEAKGCDFSFGEITADGNAVGGSVEIKATSKLTKLSAKGSATVSVADTAFDVRDTAVQVYDATVTLGAGVVIDATVKNSKNETLSTTDLIRFLSPKANLTIAGGTYKTGKAQLVSPSGELANAKEGNNVVFTINGGTFVNNQSKAITFPAGAVVTINGGDITSNAGFGGNEQDSPMFGWIAKDVKFKVNGGNITQVGGWYIIGTASTGVEITINGGYIKEQADWDGRSIQLSTKNTVTFTVNGGVLDLSCRWCVNINGPHIVTINGGYFIHRKIRGSYQSTAADTFPPYAFFFQNTTNNTEEAGSSVIAKNFTYVNEGSGNMAFGGGLTGGSGKADSTRSVYSGVYYDKNNCLTSSEGKSVDNRTGASVRICENSTGIRFTGTISAALIEDMNSFKDNDTEIVYGTIICPTDYLQGLKMSKFALDAIGCTGYKNVVATANGMETDGDGNVTIRVALVNLQEGNYARAFSACAYAMYIWNGMECYHFAGWSEDDNSRSMAQIAQDALEDIKADSEEGYTYAVEGGYSMYAPADRDVLEVFAAALD